MPVADSLAPNMPVADSLALKHIQTRKTAFSRGGNIQRNPENFMRKSCQTEVTLQ